MTTDIKKILEDARKKINKAKGLKPLVNYKDNTTEKPSILQGKKGALSLDTWELNLKDNTTEKPSISQDSKEVKDNKQNLKDNTKRTTDHGESP